MKVLWSVGIGALATGLAVIGCGGWADLGGGPPAARAGDAGPTLDGGESHPNAVLPDAGIDADAATAPSCAPGTWCIVRHAVPVSTLDAVWGSSASDVWAVGDYGTILHFDGKAWSATENDRFVHLYGVAGTSASDVWAVGNGGSILHFDGTTWSTSPSPATFRLVALWPRTPTDVWAAGEGGEILRFDGQSWTPVLTASTSFCGLWGSSVNDVWAASVDGMWHWTGGAWTQIANTRLHPMYSVWGTAANDVWAVGDSILHFDGSTWTSTPNPASASSIGLFGVWGTGATDVWAGTFEGRFAHWNGSGWSFPIADAGWGATSLYAWPAPGGAMWVVRESAPLRYFDGNAWTDVALPDDPTHATISAIWGAKPDDVWAIGGTGGILHWDGKGWTPSPNGITQGALLALGGSGANDVWAVGTAGALARWNGNAWTNFAGGGDLTGVWASSPQDAWAVGRGGQIRHWNGAQWSDDASCTKPLGSQCGGTQDGEDLFGVWGSGPSDVWAAGGGVILHYDGVAWSVFQRGSFSLGPLTGTGPNDVWASGTPMLHWDGSAWSTAGTQAFGAIWAAAPNDVWAIGNTRTVNHWDGATWTSSPTGAASPVYAIWGDAAGIWLGGMAGSILHRN